MQNQMPQMPGMPKAEGDAKASSPLVDLDVPSHASPDSADQEMPSFELKKPEYVDPGSQNSTITKVPLAPRGGIEVVANRKAFYNQERIVEGDKLTIRGEQDWGDWFNCVDPVMEKRRAKAMELKKAKK